MKELIKQLGDIRDPDERVTFFKANLLPLFKCEDPLSRDTFIKEAAKLLKPCGIRAETIRKAVASTVMEDELDEPEEQVKADPLAIFPGLVDIVVHEGQPSFLILTTGGLEVTASVEVKGRTVVPPGRESMRWTLPRASEVLRHFEADNDRDLYYDLVQYHNEISELPTSGHYFLLGVYVLLTYLQELVDYLPIIIFEGLAERGKTRTGRGLMHVAYRGVHETSVRDSHLIRYAAEYGATLFIDCMDLWQKVERQGSEDILLGRFEKGQTVRRVLWPEKGLYRDSEYYSIFGPTLLASNKRIDHILETRSLVINLPEASRKFDNDLRPEGALPLKERLVAFRARCMGAALPEAEKPCDGRLGDIARPLVQVVKMVAPEHEGIIIQLINEFRQQRLADKAESWPARVFQAFLDCEDHLVNGVMPVAVVVRAVNEDLPQDKNVTPQRIGRTLANIGLEKAMLAGGQKAYFWPSEDQKYYIAKGLGLAEKNVTNVTNIT